MRSFLNKLVLIAAALIAIVASGSPATAQAVSQSGAVTGYHTGAWASNGYLMDGGSPDSPFVNALGIFGGSDCPLGVSSQTAPGVSVQPYGLFTICQTTTGTTLNVTGVNGNPNPTLTINVGGVSYPFPGASGGDVVGPSTSAAGDLTCFNATTGKLIIDCRNYAHGNAAALTGVETILGVQSAATVNITPAQIAAYYGVSSGYVTLEQLGCRGNATFDSSYTLTNSPDDCTAAFNAFIALATAPAQSRNDATKITPTLLLNPRGTYWLPSGFPEIHTRIAIVGSASSQLRGTVLGSTFLFPRNIGGPIFQGAFTSGHTGPQGGVDLGNSEGSIVSGVNFVGIGSSYASDAYGFQMRTDVDLNKAQFWNIASDCVHIVAYNAGTGGDHPNGLANGFSLDAIGHSCGEDGLEIGGSDVNAARVIQWAVHGAGLSGFGGAGVKNYAVLTNRFDLGDIAGYANTGVYNSGVDYQLIDNTAGIGGATTPGTDKTVWWPLNADTAASTRFPQWVSLGTYAINLPIWDSGGGALYNAPYIEVSSTRAYVKAPSLLFNSTEADNAGGGNLGACADIIAFRGVICSPTGMGGVRYLINNDIGQFGYPMIGGASGAYAYSLVGSVDNADGQVINQEYRNNRAGSDFSWTEKFNTAGDLVLQWATGDKQIRWQSGNEDGIGTTSTPAKAGRFSTIYNTVGLPGFMLGGALSNTDSPSNSGYRSTHRLFQLQNAAPTAGQFAQGEHIFNYGVAAGGIDAWVATTTGAVAAGAWAPTTNYVVGSIVTNDTGPRTYVSIQPAVWIANHAYSTGALITGQTGQKYSASVGGTSSATGLGPIGAGTKTDGGVTWVSYTTPQSAGSVGPTGTGTSIIDNTVLWSFANAYVLTADYLNERASPTTGVGYVTGAGGTVTQGTSRTTAVVLSKVSGAITLFSAAGSATPFTFTVTNTAVATTDTVSLSVKSGSTDVYRCATTAVAAGSFNISCDDLTGTTVEAPVINFNVIKGVISFAPTNDNLPWNAQTERAAA